MNTKYKRRRPFLVWVISFFYLFSAGWTLLSIYLVQRGVVQPTLQQTEYLDSLTSIDWTVSILIALAGMSGAICLFLLRRLAFYLLTTSLTLNILTSIWHVLTKGALIAMGGPAAIGMLIGMGISAAICIYTWHLLKTEILS
jgi:hypothetical protein